MKKTILIVDDVLVNRSLLKQALISMGDFEVVEAVDGNGAIEKYKECSPDLILMDIIMPRLGGKEATTIIKEKTKGVHVPIIFVSALDEGESLATAIESGGDDYISKPFNIDVLASKINAQLRVRELSQQIKSKNDYLLAANNKLKYEKFIIQHFFENALQQSYLDESLIKYNMSPMSTFNGDLLLVQRAPNGGFYLIMGDFSGHGLTAAMGTLPVAMIFFKMVAESLSVEKIAYEINSQLHKLMPLDMFFAATILEVNHTGNVMSVWMGGMPENYWFNRDGKLKGLIHSQHMPLGILEDDKFDSLTQTFNVEIEDKIYLYSDGVIEAKNLSGELFGDERLKNILIENKENRFQQAIQSFNDFTGVDEQQDDITFVELNCCVVEAQENEDNKTLNESTLP